MDTMISLEYSERRLAEELVRMRDEITATLDEGGEIEPGLLTWNRITQQPCTVGAKLDLRCNQERKR